MYAVIDIGSNSILLLIGSRDTSGHVSVALDLCRISRLSQGVGQTGLLHPEAIQRTLVVLREYRSKADEYHAPLTVVATEGLRMAKNQDAFLKPAQDILGVPVRMIQGHDEAELSYLSIARELPTPVNEHLRVLDIGGASTELVVGTGLTIHQRHSHPIGSVRLTEAYLSSDPPTASQLKKLEQVIRETFAQQPLSPHPQLYGLAGTVTTAAALLLDLPMYNSAQVDGQCFSTEAILELRNQLAKQSIDQRLRHPCLEPGRADVIVAGLSILWLALIHCGAGTLVVRDRGLRFALL